MRELFGTFIILPAVGLGTTAGAADPPGWAYGFPPAWTPVPTAATPAPLGPVPGLAGARHGVRGSS
jgi:hypothetical protein